MQLYSKKIESAHEVAALDGSNITLTWDLC